MIDKSVIIFDERTGTVRLAFFEWHNPAAVERVKNRYPEWAGEIERQVAELKSRTA